MNVPRVVLAHGMHSRKYQFLLFFSEEEPKVSEIYHLPFANIHLNGF